MALIVLHLVYGHEDEDENNIVDCIVTIALH